jgi:hypothetical protein
VTAPAARTAPRRLWLGLLCAGAVVWALATAITAVTRDTILVPTVIMVGSFLVPATMVAFALTRAHTTRLEPGLLLAGFFAAGALFAAAPAGRLRISRGVAATFAGVVLLHAAWDATYGASIIVTRGLEGEGWSLGWPNTEAWVGDPTGGTLVTFQVVYDVLIAVNGLVGATWAVRRWRRYGRAA